MLRLADVDFEGRSIRVARGLHRKGRRIDTPKGGEGRDVDMSASLTTVLLTQVARRQQENLGRGHSEETSPWLFTNSDGTPLDESRVRKVMARILKQARLPSRFSPHSLRHSFVTHHLALGHPPLWMAGQVGDTVETILRVYAWALPSGDRKYADALDAAVTGKPGAVEENESTANSSPDLAVTKTRLSVTSRGGQSA